MGQRKLEQVQIDLFRDEGFLALPEIFDVAATQEVQQLLDPLLQDFHKLPEGELRGEVNRALRMEPRLTHSTVYRTCQAFAKQLIGRHAAYSFDHAIYKLPYSDHETPWHQDQAYMGHPVSFNTVHFWVPLQDVTERNGCMQFVRGSHRLGLLPHHRRNQESHDHKLEVTEIDRTLAVSCPLHVGGVTVHTPLTLHYTSPNITDAVRRAWIIHFGPFGQWAKLHPKVVLKIIQERLGPLWRKSGIKM